MIRYGGFQGRIRHNFSYKSLLKKIKVLAKREGIEVIEVDPSYTSIIGMLKYAPQYMITKDIAAAYVIARRGLGLQEKFLGAGPMAFPNTACWGWESLKGGLQIPQLSKLYIFVQFG